MLASLFLHVVNVGSMMLGLMEAETTVRGNSGYIHDKFQRRHGRLASTVEGEVLPSNDAETFWIDMIWNSEDELHV